MDNLEDHISPEIGQKMITPQECLHIKREMEADDEVFFDPSPLALCMMITLLLFGICLWIWLISWSCFFGQSPEKDVNKDDNTILSGDVCIGSQKLELRLGNRSIKKRPNLTLRSQLLKHINPLADMNYVLHPESSRPEGRTLSPTEKSETQVSGPSSAPSSLAKEDAKAPKKYKIKWTKFLKLSRNGDPKK